MSTVLVFFAVLGGAVFFHELGHAIAMRECGVRVRLFMIGVPIPLFTFSVVSERLGRFFGNGFVFRLSPLLLGGAVVPHKDGVSRMEHELSCSEHAYIFGAGPLWNLLAIIVVLAGAFLYMAIMSGSGNMGITIFSLKVYLLYWQLAGIMIALTLVVWALRKFICRIVLPILGIIFLVLLLRAFLDGLISQVWESGNFAYMGKEAAGVKNTSGFIVFWMLINSALFFFNILPLYPLDGGHIVNKAISSRSQKLSNVFRVSGIAFVVALIALVIFADLRKVFAALF